jgi:hypothetical protein
LATNFASFDQIASPGPQIVGGHLLSVPLCVKTSRPKFLRVASRTAGNSLSKT